MNNEEPERYYDWILWKLKQERKMSEDQLELDFTSHLGEGITTTDSIIRREMYEMQKHIHGLQMRIKELAEENYELRKKVETIMPDLSDKIPEVTGK
jgi:polyhydroxyalkanoate synthesis regulator phasin